ncbi:MAG: N-methyl-D-aspartate receptor NMDAR2C subunit [bacterium]|nr:N-methyl-D-aspartate receptor NMDAR2C subunit [bacterium]
MENKNEEKWFRLCGRIAVEGSFERTRAMHKWTFAGIVRAYMSEGRAYHNFSHIEQCLDEFEQVGCFLRNPDAVEFALWYHDIIYDASAKDNEERSARVAVLQASDLGFSVAFTEKVSRLILATKHDVVPEDSDAKMMADIDLSIFGQSEDKFDEYERRIRQEYSWVPKEDFCRGRAGILQIFLDRSTIFSTMQFRNRYELQARKNLVRARNLLQRP